MFVLVAVAAGLGATRSDHVLAEAFSPPSSRHVFKFLLRKRERRVGKREKSKKSLITCI